MNARRRVANPQRPAGAAPGRWLRVLAGVALATAASSNHALAQDAGAPGTGAAPTASSDAPVALGALLRAAQSDLARSDAGSAYARLNAQLRWYAGSPEFDYLLGLAALDSGRAAHAVLAFERVLAVKPDHLQARAELARALLATREPEAARREFEAVSAQSIPADARRVIDRYLAQIDRQSRDIESKLTGFAELGFGWDSNVNLGSASSTWLLSSGIAVIPSASSVERGSPVLSAAAGLSWQRPIGGGWELTAGTQVLSRSNPSAHTLDQSVIDLSAGVERRAPCHALTMLAQLQHMRVDDRAFRNASGVLAQWRCDLDRHTQVGAYGQHFDLRFPDQDIRDARRDIVGATFARAFAAPRDPIVVANAFVGVERPTADVPQLHYRFHGVKAVASAELGGRWRGWASIGFESREFEGSEPIFVKTRSDRQREIRLGADHAIDRSWVVSPQISYTRNASNLPPNDFRRTQVQVVARYRF